MDPKIVNLNVPFRQPLPEFTPEEEAEDLKRQSIEAHVMALEDVLRMVRAGDMEGLVIVGKHKTGHFYTDLVFPHGRCEPQEALTYVGVLEGLKLEMNEIASMAPSVMFDGSILDPFAEKDQSDD
jgi:hypothetical protein